VLPGRVDPRSYVLRVDRRSLDHVKDVLFQLIAMDQPWLEDEFSVMLSPFCECFTIDETPSLVLCCENEYLGSESTMGLVLCLTKEQRNVLAFHFQPSVGAEPCLSFLAAGGNCIRHGAVDGSAS
jgi:hypothetical protein